MLFAVRYIKKMNFNKENVICQDESEKSVEKNSATNEHKFLNTKNTKGC